MNEKAFADMLMNYPECMQDNKRFRALIYDLFPGEKQICNILINLYQLDLPRELENTSIITDALCHRYVKNVITNYGIDSSLAEEAVKLWVYGYGRTYLNKKVVTQRDLKSDGQIKKEKNESENQQQYKSVEDERGNIPCEFDNGVTREEFATYVRSSIKKVKHLQSVEIDGPLVMGTIKSHSGSSEWSFILDYNDYGMITGKYWAYCENEDSDIPIFIADKISAYIKQDISEIDEELSDGDDEGNIIVIERMRSSDNNEKSVEADEDEYDEEDDEDEDEMTPKNFIIALIIVLIAIGISFLCVVYII